MGLWGQVGAPRIRDELTFTLMMRLLKLFSTTIMSSESDGESVPSWLRTKNIKLMSTRRQTTELKHERLSAFVEEKESAWSASPVNLVDFIGSSFPQLQHPGAGVGFELKVALEIRSKTTFSKILRHIWTFQTKLSGVLSHLCLFQQLLQIFLKEKKELRKHRRKQRYKEKLK